MSIRRLFCSTLLGLALSSSAVSQTTPLITVDKVMTGEQLQTTGVNTLTPVQRAALDRWLSDYTVMLFQLAKTPSPEKLAPSTPANYLGSSGGHWIKSKVDDGAMIILEDGSMWQIDSVDRVDTALWLPITNVTVLKASSPIGEYKYMLINIDDGEKALAKFLGKQ